MYYDLDKVSLEKYEDGQLLYTSIIKSNVIDYRYNVHKVICADATKPIIDKGLTITFVNIFTNKKL